MIEEEIKIYEETQPIIEEDIFEILGREI